MPITFAAALAGAMSMAGLPPMFGFVGKELVMESALHAPRWQGVLVVAAVVMAGLTVAAALLAGLKPFVGGHLETAKEPRESPWALLFGPIVLGAVALIAGVVPQWVLGGCTAACADAVYGSGVGAGHQLALWHGFTPALGLSVIAVVVGALLYVLHRYVWALGHTWSHLDFAGPESIYRGLMGLLEILARQVTRLLQNGYLRFYVLFTLLTALIATGSVLVGETAPPNLARAFDEVHFYEAALIGLIIVGALMAVHSRGRLGAVASLGVVGYSITLFYVMFGAPDLAMTQFSIETLTVILLVLVLYRLPRFAVYTGTATRIRDMVVAGVAGALVTVLVLLTGQFEPLTPVSGYYSDHALDLGKGRNVVNVILVDFRAIDTLGETTVLAIAAVGVYTLLRLRSERAGFNAVREENEL